MNYHHFTSFLEILIRKLRLKHYEILSYKANSRTFTKSIAFVLDIGKKNETNNSVTTTKCQQYSFETKILWDYVSFVTFCDIKFRVSIDFDSKMKFTSNVSLPQVTSQIQICLFPPFYSIFRILHSNPFHRFTTFRTNINQS